MAILGRKSPIYIFFPLFFNQVVVPHKSLFYFVVFVVVLLWRVVCVDFRWLVMAGTSVLGDSDSKAYLIRSRRRFKSGHRYVVELESYEF